MHRSVPRTRASSDGVDDSDSGEWIYLKRGVDREGCGPIGLRGHCIKLCSWVRLPSRESGGTRHLEAVLMCFDSLRLSSCAQNPHCREACRYPTQAAVNLVAGLGVSQVVSKVLVRFVIIVTEDYDYMSQKKRLLVLRLLSQQKKLFGRWFCIQYILSITLRCRSVNAKMEMLLERTVEVQGDSNCFNQFEGSAVIVRMDRLTGHLIVSTPIDMSKIAEAKYPDCDIYVENVILSGDLIALPFEDYGMILGMDGSEPSKTYMILAPDLHAASEDCIVRDLSPIRGPLLMTWTIRTRENGST
ncbi:hypothetical protein M9H77_14524 [Catharanthus roseus]|uniref:Uncharacterized protein n=1 Tax=Catharanthus roseus TaxID=4058 RepID=A0ACC0BNG9_CATRO|nr:hypothetical protein M9H77_14524 [Catharanthus roseus]